MTAKYGLSGRLTGVGDKGECAACTAPSTHFVNIEGDGPIRRYNVCGRHESIARNDARRFLRHVGSKAEFVADPDALKDEARERRERNP